VSATGNVDQNAGMEVTTAPPRRRWRGPVFLAAFVAFVGVWTFAFWYDANRPTPEPLDTASRHAATAACRSAITRLSDLGPVPESGVFIPAPLIARIRSEDNVFGNLVAGLTAIHPTDGAGAEALKAFATDWRHLMAARERYADALNSGKTHLVLVIPVDPSKKPITIRMREYADIHGLTACTPDSLQGEVVEGPRTYPRVP
jgi:hypothetical protein